MTDEIRLESFAEEARYASDRLSAYGGTTELLGRRFTFRDAQRLRRVSDDIRRYLKGEMPDGKDRMQRIADLVRAWEARPLPVPDPGDTKPSKTYVVNRAMRYRMGLYLEHLDSERIRFQNDEMQSVTALGKTFTDAGDFGDFVTDIRNLYDETLRHRVSGNRYGLAKKCAEAGERLEKGEKP